MSDLLAVADMETEDISEEQQRPPVQMRDSADVEARRKRKPKGLTGKPTVPMVERIEHLIKLSGGATLVEIGADLQTRFGSYTAIEARFAVVDARKNKTWVGDSEKTQKELKATRVAEIAKYIAVTEKYLTATYGEPFKDDHGKIIGLGDGSRIIVNEKPGHYQRLY